MTNEPFYEMPSLNVYLEFQRYFKYPQDERYGQSFYNKFIKGYPWPELFYAQNAKAQKYLGNIYNEWLALENPSKSFTLSRSMALAIWD